MAHRIVILGGGYAGVTAANRLARRIHGAEIVLVNDRATFVERVRLHQLAAGETLVEQALAARVRPAVSVLVAAVRQVDLERRRIRVATTESDTATDSGTATDGGGGAGTEWLAYDTLVYALGSTAGPAPDDAVPLATAGDAWRVRERIAELAAQRGTAAVVGGGLTGVEAAAELAERNPSLRVRMVSDVDPASWLSARAQAHVRRVFGRLGIDVLTGSAVTDAADGAVRLADGRAVGSGLTLACTGFAVPPLARRTGLAVDERGRIRVDATLRSVSHPDVYAVGDAAVPETANGRVYRMACATALPTSGAAGTAIADRLAGRTPSRLHFRYVNQCVSLGRRDGVIQAVDADDRPHRSVLTGAAAARYKEVVVRGATWFSAHPGPYRPVRAVTV